jgi:lysine 2,3-aminomutase
MPNYMVSYSDHKVILRNYEGYITTYEEPAEYTPHDSSTCRYCQNPRPEPGQEGITALLDGKRMWIEPAGFEQVHDRGATDTHRLKDPSKWVPYGVGAIEGRSAEGEAGLPVLDSGTYGPGEEPRPADGQPTATANHELV